MRRLSYAYGSGGCPRLYMTIPSLLDQRANKTPDKPAHIFRFQTQDDHDNSISGRTVLTFKEMADKSLHLAASFLGMGLQRGDKVALMGVNCPEWLLLEYACMRIGVLLMKLPSNITTAEDFCQIIKESESKILVVDQESSLKLLLTAYPRLVHRDQDLNKYGFSKLTQILFLRMTNDHSPQYCDSIIQLLELCPKQGHVDEVKVIQDNLNPDDLALSFLTSGSTGKPKSILYSHYSVINNLNNCLAKASCKSTEPHELIYFNDRPFAWVGSQCFSPTTFDLTQVHMDAVVTLGGDAITKVFNVMREEKVTTALLLQYLLFDAKQATESGKFAMPPTLRSMITGGERIPEEILSFSLKSFESVTIVYGATECFAVALAVPEYGQNGEININWYKLFPNVEMKLVDNHEKTVPLNVVGSVCIRSSFAMHSYMGTGEKMKGNWINIGDLAQMREDGHFEIIGRSKDVISHGAVKVYPKVLENILYRYDKVDNVVVVGVPDPRMFQEVCACVQPKPGAALTEAELREFFNSQILANPVSCVPRYYLIMDEIPKGLTGKYDRKELMKHAAEYFSLV